MPTKLNIQYVPLSPTTNVSVVHKISHFHMFESKNILIAIGFLTMMSLLILLSFYGRNDSHFPIRPWPKVELNYCETEWLCFDVSYWDDPLENCWAREYIGILMRNQHLFVIEPHLLSETMVKNGRVENNKTIGQMKEEINDLKWRFDLPGKFDWKRNCLTVGVMADQLNLEQLQMGKFVETSRVTGANGPFNYPKETNQVLHLFYQRKKLSQKGTTLHIHVVVFYQVKHFLWIGAIPAETKSSLASDLLSTLHFGKYAQIYDTFKRLSIDGISFPDDIAHFLSQLSTDRYLHCPPERTTKWFATNNQKINERKVEASKEGFANVKLLMRKLKMQFWIACGTLLGWYRQCHITPYTSDTDFDTWSKYMQQSDMTPVWLKEAPAFDLRLLNRFGEPSASQEFSLASNKFGEKFDLFFIYPNGTHFLLPFHLPSSGQYQYSIYPKYELCSVELLGFKLLAPCDPESIVLTEYGPNWSQPISSWDYSASPKNVGPLMKWDFNGAQMKSYG